uniref:Uncharacterized protein n=1 Tax=Clytia hemisphaerica TaxID=252671 RepID=A0A7M5VBG0_9CNID
NTHSQSLKLRASKDVIMKTWKTYFMVLFLALIGGAFSMSTGGNGIWEGSKKKPNLKQDTISLLPEICNICSKAKSVCPSNPSTSSSSSSSTWSSINHAPGSIVRFQRRK